MIIHSIHLQHLGPFNDSVQIGPAAPGINVLAAVNESGKTTLITAAVRCLFDKHTCKDSEIKQLQPAGTDLAPRVRVDFQVGDTRYRIAKKFLNSPTSELFERRDDDWKLIAEADMADSRLVELLGSQQAGRGATKPAHWGMTRYLWGRQGEPADWPEWEGESGNLIRARLAKVEIDPIVAQLAETLMKDYSCNFTNSGKPKKGGKLKNGEESLAALQEKLADTQKQLKALEAKELAFQAAQEELRLLESEHDQLESDANQVKQAAGKAEGVAREVETLASKMKAAEDRLTTVTEDTATLAGIETRLKEVTTTHQALKPQGEKLEGKQQAANNALQETKKNHRDLVNTAKSIGDSGQRVADILSYRNKITGLEELRRKLDRVRRLDAEIGELKKKLAKLPGLTPAKVRKLEELDQSVREKRIQIDAQGITVELKPSKAGKAVVEADGDKRELELTAGSEESLSAAQQVHLKLTGWGEILVQSGAHEVKELSEALAEVQSELNESLNALALESVEAAKTALRERSDLNAALKPAENFLKDALDAWEDLASMESSETAMVAQTKKLADQLKLTAEEKAASTADLEAEQEATKVKTSAIQAELSESDEAIESAQEASNDAISAVNDHEKAVLENTGLVQSEERRKSDIEGRYPAGITAALSDAKKEFVQAEARCQEKRKELPEDYENLPARNRRAAAAVAEVKGDLDAKKKAFHQLEGELKIQGAGGLYSQETRMLEEIERTETEVNHTRKRGWAARLVHDLIAYRKNEATRSVLKPLEDRLSEQFAAITRQASRRVMLNEDLQIQGIGREGEMIPFDALSQGAREQLLLSLRLAVALELAEEAPQCLILDDVLVNSDRARQERIMDVLQAAQKKIQIFILTCHPDWYRGLGNPLEMTVAE